MREERNKSPLSLAFENHNYYQRRNCSDHNNDISTPIISETRHRKRNHDHQKKQHQQQPPYQNQIIKNEGKVQVLASQLRTMQTRRQSMNYTPMIQNRNDYIDNDLEQKTRHKQQLLRKLSDFREKSSGDVYDVSGLRSTSKNMSCSSTDSSRRVSTHDLKLLKNELIQLNRRQSSRLLLSNKYQHNHDIDDKNIINHHNIMYNSYEESYVATLKNQLAFTVNHPIPVMKDDYHRKSLCSRPIQSSKNTKQKRIHHNEYNGRHHQKYPYAKDYIRLAKEYKQASIYHNANPNIKNRCIICKEKAKTDIIRLEQGKVNYFQHKRQHDLHQRRLIKVLFPCEHRPICNHCWDENNNRTWTKCPVCNEDIKITFDHCGNEVEQYWEWVNEIKPRLPISFLKSFARHSKRSIAEAMVKSIDNDHAGSVVTVKGGTIRKHADDSIPNQKDFHNRDIIQSKACIIC